MTAKRIKAPTESNRIATRAEAEAAVNEISLLVINQTRATAEMDAKIAAIKKNYEPGLGLYAEALKEKTECLQLWAIAHPEEFPKDRKSIQFPSGTIGFRTGTPKLSLLNRKWTWDLVLKKLIEFGSDFIRTKEEVDKDAILARHAAKEVCDGELGAFGVKVTQDESFYVEPILTPVTDRQVRPLTEAA